MPYHFIMPSGSGALVFFSFFMASPSSCIVICYVTHRSTVTLTWECVSCLTSLIFCWGRFTVLLAWYTLANTFAGAFPVKSLQSVELFCPTGCCLSAHLWADKATVSFSDLEMLSSPAISNWFAVFSSVQRNALADFDIWFLIWVDLFHFLLGITH